LLLKDKERTPREIAAYFDFTLPALSTHLKVLRDAGLVNDRREGQSKYYSVNKDSISEMMTSFDVFWDDRLKRFKEYVENNARRKRK
jgi:ArsR family transcriptional regulator, arsenate/arsenite/antimonite-responsive transcriptional repressor